VAAIGDYLFGIVRFLSNFFWHQPIKPPCRTKVAAIGCCRLSMDKQRPPASKTERAAMGFK